MQVMKTSFCKIYLLVLFFFPLPLLAWDFDTPVTITVADAPISQVFLQLSEKFKIPVTYNQNSRLIKKHISISVTNMLLGKMLDDYIVPQGIRYKRIADQLVISVTSLGASPIRSAALCRIV
jgi:hypothetical protein